MHSSPRTHCARLRVRVHQAALAAFFLVGAIPSQAAPPDLTNGGVPGDSTTTNLGATGMRGWVYHIGAKSDESRQILVTAVAAGSPAAGILAADDVILGANGTGAEPVNFSSDARRAMADAINDTEARDPATLKLIRWRAGATPAVETVELTLRSMGAYSATAPYNCPKSAKILQEALASIMGTNVLGQPVSQETSGRYSFGTLSLLAADNPLDPANAARMARAETEALALIPSAATMTQMMSDVRDTGSGWQRGHTLIVLAEYYLVTGDTRVLPAIEAYAVNIAKNQSLFGTLGHIYAEKNKDGSNNGPMGGQYGPVNSAGMPCFLGVLLARQCGLSNPETIALIDASIERTSRFFAYYAGRGSIPYGEHEPGTSGHENNGKCGLAALCFGLQGSRITEGQFFAKMATAATTEREIGHTGAWFNYIWAPLGAAAGGEETAASYFQRARWYYDLARRWDGGFDYDCFGEGPKNGAQYNDFRMSTAALLTYALPLRKLHLTGRSHDPARDLTSTDVAEAEFADGYDATLRGTSDLVTDLGDWSPTVQRRAAGQLATRSIDSTLLAQITTLATDPGSQSRVGACYTLGKISNSSTANARAATLAGLLTDPDNKVRFIAAEAMRYLPQTAKMTQLNAVLSAAASTATPLMPFDEEDPLHFAHGRLALLLFYSGNAYGPKGMIWGTGINGVNRNLLYPAIQAVAANPVGQARSTLDLTYQNLTAADVNALADTLVESIHFRAPSDKMFSAGIRNGGLKALEKFNNADGVPLALAYMVDDGRTDAYTAALSTLQKYAGGSITVTPDPDVIGFCQSLLGGGSTAAAQAVLDAIAADLNPVTLTPFKSIQSVTVEPSSLTLPANQTVLHASASDLALGDMAYTWRKVHGAGNVSFTPNGTASAKDCTIVFDNIPGQYLFEVTVSDSRGFTEVYGTVPFTLYDVGGTLPTNNPPTAIPQAVSAIPASMTPITLTGSDPEGYPLFFTVTSPPVHGTLTGTAPNLNYTAEGGYTGSDSFAFQVMDSEGQVSSASINITVVAVSVEPDVYEPFDYPVGVLTGKNGGLGFSGGWLAPRGVNEQGGVWDENTNVLFDGSTLDWDGVLNNGFPTLPKPGARYVGPTASVVSNLNISRTLSTNAGALAGEDGILWLSAVYQIPNRNSGAGINIGLGNGYIYDRGRSFGTTTTDFIGASGWIPVSTWNSKLNTVVVNDTWSITTDDAWTASPSALPATTLDMIVVLKFTFGAASDTVEGYVFHEDATTELTEATFESGKIATTSSIDESTLNVLSVAQGRFNNAIDEIRIGNSFASVIGVQGAPPDTTPPTLAGTDIVDDRAGEPVVQNSPVTYSVTFSEEMNPATVDATDFSNAGSASIMIDSIIHPLPGVFVIQVTPTTAGSLQLQVNVGAVLTDAAGNPLDTTQAIADDTIITVNPLIVPVPNVTGVPQASAESSIISAYLVIGTVTTQNSEAVPTGDVISQSPTGGTSIAGGSGVDLVVSLGPVPDYETWQAQYPSAALANRADDFDGDGVSNGEERLWGLDPTKASPVTPILEAPGPAGTFRYTRRNPARTSASYSIWTSPSLLPDSWTEDTDASQLAGDPDANHVETVTVTLSPGRLGGTRLFVRVRVTE